MVCNWIRHRVRLTLGGGLCLAAAATAVGASPTTQPVGIPPPVTRTPLYPAKSRVTEEMFGRDTREVIILPSEPGSPSEDQTQRSGGAIARLPMDMHRLPEGYIVAGREAKVEQRAPWDVLTLAQVAGLPDAPPLRVLPNSRLAMLDSMMADNATPTVVVSGRITEFNGSNYILIETLSEVAPASPQRAAEPPKATTPAPTTGPAREPTAEEVIRHLMENRPRRVVPLPQASTQPAAATGEGPRWTEDTQIIDRAGRIVPGDPWWMFAFEDVGCDVREKPIRLLPNEMLETALGLTGGGTRAVVLMVSGEITVYKGVNYMLLRKVLVRPNLGNLR